MKTLLNFLSFVLFLLIAIIVLTNISNTISIETNFISLRANVGFLIFFCAIISSLGTIFLILARGSFLQADKNKLEKQAEDTKLDFEIELEKVNQLEAKIKTLERALKIATGK